MNKLIVASHQDQGKRLDWFVSENSGISRSYAQNIIAKGLVILNNKQCKPGYKLKENDAVAVQIPEPQQLNVKPQEIELDIIYEDRHLLVVNKPQGMVVHPAAGNYENTLVNALLSHCRDDLSSINGVIRPGIVHRIDKDTSGLLLVAKNDVAHVKLAEQIKSHSLTRKYEAIACGTFKDQTGKIDLPIGRSIKDRKKMSVYTAMMLSNRRVVCREAITHYKVLKTFDTHSSAAGGYSYVELRLETGRTHQIRVHLSHLGRPVLGDQLYGNTKKNASMQTSGQILHAKELGFIHPSTGEYMEYEAPLPPHFLHILNLLTLQEKRSNMSNNITQ